MTQRLERTAARPRALDTAARSGALFAIFLLTVGCAVDVPVEGFLSRGILLGRTSEGGLTVSVRTASAGMRSDVEALLDTGSPLSAIAQTDGCDPERPNMLELADIGTSSTQLGFPTAFPVCYPSTTASAFDSVVGGDWLSSFEIVFSAGSPRCRQSTSPLSCLELRRIELEPTRALGYAGYSVLSFRRLGGGLYLDADGRMRNYLPSRVVIRTCVGADPATGARGHDATWVVATGIGPPLLSRSAATRLGFAAAGATESLTLPGSGTISVTRSTRLGRITLVGPTNSFSSLDPGPCGELLRARCLRQRSVTECNRMAFAPEELDEISGDQSDAAAYVELDVDSEVRVASDEEPYLQAAGREVEPRLSGIDGFISADMLALADEVRIDYPGVPDDPIDPGARLIVRCRPQDARCHSCARTALSQTGTIQTQYCP